MNRLVPALCLLAAYATAGPDPTVSPKQAWKTYRRSMKKLATERRNYEKKELGPALREALQMLYGNWNNMNGRPETPNEFVFVIEGFERIYDEWAAAERRKAELASELVPMGGEKVAKEALEQLFKAVKTIVTQDKALKVSKPRHFVLVHEQKPGVLRHGAYALLDALVEVLGELRDEDALRYVLTAGVKKAASLDRRSRRDLARIALIDALGLTGRQQVLPFLQEAAGSGEPRIRIAALEALARLPEDPATLDERLATVICSDRCYAVRLAALELLRPSAARRQVLLDASARAKGLERARLREALGPAPGKDAGTRAAAEDPPSLSGIPSAGSRIYLILDASYFWSTPADLELARTQHYDHWNKMRADDRDYVTQWQLELRETTVFLQRLREGMTLNILTIDKLCGFTPFDERRMVPVTGATRRKALAYVAGIKPNTHGWGPAIEAIWRAYEQGGADPWGTKVPDEPGVDTIYLVGDSVPGAGQLIHVGAVIDDVKRHHRFYRIPIHCVRVGYTEKSGKTMEGIAKATGGKYVWHQKP